MIRALILFITAVSLFGQQSELWVKTYGGQYLDAGYCAIETSDGGFAVVGSTQGTEGQNDIWLLKTDSIGDTLWTKTFDTNYHDRASSLQQLADGGYLITAHTYLSTNVLWLIRTDSLGETIWTNTYEGTVGNSSRASKMTSDGGLIITGRKYNTSNSSDDLWLLRVDSVGTELWIKSYGGDGHDAGQAVEDLPDGGFLVVGKIDNRAPTYTYDDIWILRTNSVGDTLWTRSIGGPGGDEAISMIKNLSGSITIIGRSDWSTNLFIDIDINGNIINTRSLEYSDDGYGDMYDIFGANDNSYIIVGSKYTNDDNHSDIWISKFDSEFGFVWEYLANIAYHDRGYSIRPIDDGGFIITGVAGSEPSVWPEADNLVLMRISSIESPGNLRATPGNNQVTLQWESYVDAHKYYVFRDSAQPATSLIDSVLGPIPDSAYVDTELAIGQYFYRIKAINNSGIESGYSRGVNTIVRDTLNVPADYSTIQAALNNAAEGSCILVQPGEYQENLFWPDIPLVKLLAAGDSSNTIIRGNGSGSVIYVNPVNSILDTNTVIEGFTITGGGNTQNGGGIFISDANIRLERMLITGNSATSNGGGICLVNSKTVLITSKILLNTAQSGGGLYIDDGKPTVDNVFVSENNANNGGGIYVIDSDPIFTNSNVSGNIGGGFYIEGGATVRGTIISNNTKSNGQGGGLYIEGNVYLSDVEVIGNSAEDGGGIKIHESSPNITNVRISNNTASSDGGGVQVGCYDRVARPNLTNVTIENNSARVGGGMYLGGNYSRSSEPSLNHVLIKNNIATGSIGGGGIYTTYRSIPIITQSTICENSATTGKGGGLYISASSTMSEITICNNTAYGDGGGIYFNQTSGTYPTITEATISNNSSQTGINGIFVQSGSPTITNSNFVNNMTGFFNFDNSVITSCIQNYWGDATGPYHSSQNAVGVGDSANAFVNVTPWLTEPNVQAPPIPIQNLHITNSGIDFIDLAWDEAVMGDLAGYRIYYTTDPIGGTYDDSLEVGLNTTFSLSNLSPGYVYKIVATCYDIDTNESWYSQEVLATPQPASIIGTNPPALDFSTLLVGEARSMELTITNSGTDILAVSDILHSTENVAVSANTFEIPLGEDITITIQLTPSYYGLSGDTLVIQNNSFNNPSFHVPVQWFGDLPENPVILAVNDIPADQGGQVRVSFAGSKYDGYDGSQEITSYSVWRHLESETWDAIGMFNAVQDSIYHFVAPTLCDSTGEGNCWSSYRVSAHTANAEIYFYSDSLGGYSVDNIAPAIPDGLLALAIGERVQLQWNSSLDGDFQYFAIYRSTQSDFDPDTLNTYLYMTIDTVFEDTEFEEDGTYYYRISAFDYSGNESGYSVQAAVIIVAIDGDSQIPQDYVLWQNFPNPFNPSTTIRFGLPEDSHVSLVIYDLRGNVVHTLESGTKAAGWYDLVWNGQTSDGRSISTGLYFARIVAGDYSNVIKMLYLK